MRLSDILAWYFLVGAGFAVFKLNFLTVGVSMILPVHEELLREFQGFVLTLPTPKALMEYIAQTLHRKMARYNWVGFYLLNPADPGVLVVGPFVGSFTPNVRIPLDTGLCGAAARNRKMIVVHDVAKDPRYLSGSSMVKCEVVVPIFVKNDLAAELDIESYFAGTFTRWEQEFIEACAMIVGNHLGNE
jgi:L-methionine (R)-S-oxide reductase